MFLAERSLKEAAGEPYTQGSMSSADCMDLISNKLTTEWRFQLPFILLVFAIISTTTVSACFFKPAASSRDKF